MESELLIGDCAETLKKYPTETFDCIVTDPPYGYNFMGKEWDKALPSLEALKQCCRVLKSGAFAFFMSAPRQDMLSRMIIRLEDAGFQTGFTSIYWIYATGFPKAANVGKLLDKRNGRKPEEYKALGEYLRTKRELNGRTQKEIAVYFPSKTGGLTGCYWNWENAVNVPTLKQWGILKELLDLDSRFDELIEREEAEREVISREKQTFGIGGDSDRLGYEKIIDLPATEAAKQFDGAYAGFQPKPALEVIITVMKPLSEKTYVDQALKNGKGVTWLGDCKIPYRNESDNARKGNKESSETNTYGWAGTNTIYKSGERDVSGRFPANLLVSDDVLNDGTITKSVTRTVSKTELENEGYREASVYGKYSENRRERGGTDSGSFSRYFDLDAWFASKLPEAAQKTYPCLIVPKPAKSEKNKYCENKHPTVKPLKLMSYLITMGSREGDLILDPFAGSGTTLEAARILNRKFVGCELSDEYINIVEARAGISAMQDPYRNIIEITEKNILSIRELEDSLTDYEWQNYFNMTTEVPIDLYDNIKKAFWMGRGIKI